MISKDVKEKILYLFFGALTTLVNFVCYYLFTDVIRMHYMYANALAWVLAVLFAYITNRRYVFTVSKKSGVVREVVAFFSLRGVSGVIDMLLMFVFVTLIGVNDTISKVGVNVLVVALNYLFSKFIIFRDV